MDPTVDLFSTITLYMPIVECNKLAVTRDTLHMSFQATNAIVKTTIHLILHNTNSMGGAFTKVAGTLVRVAKCCGCFSLISSTTAKASSSTFTPPSTNASFL